MSEATRADIFFNVVIPDGTGLIIARHESVREAEAIENGDAPLFRASRYTPNDTRPKLSNRVEPKNGVLSSWKNVGTVNTVNRSFESLLERGNRTETRFIESESQAV